MAPGTPLAGIGVLGGTFDPIHYGHLRAALDVQEGLGLSTVKLIPLNAPPHRPAPVAPATRRAAMIEAAIEGVPGLELDTRELVRGGVSYTFETLHSLRGDYPETPLYLLVGNDAFRHFPDWYRPEDILELTHVVVMQRPNETRPGHYADRVATDAASTARDRAGRILYRTVTQLDISATMIRQMVRRGLSPRFLLPDPVLDIIVRDHLYLD